MSSIPASHPTADRLAAYRAGRLSQADAAEVARHVTACKACRDQLQKTTVGSASSPAATLAGSVTKTTASNELTGLFGRYRIVKRLGRGGMGSVYLAHDTQLDRPVALKVPHFAGKDKDRALERFYREARAAATLTHANLCPVYDVGEINGTHYLTMAYIEGRPLSDFIEPGKPLPERHVAAVVRKLALALQEAHSHGVVHRDLKPANVMINKKKEPVIMDFGLARQAKKEDVRLTQVGSIMGTPAYMPPEQVQGDVDAMGAGCDVYSLGVILYEMLTGRLPFEGPMAAVLGQIMVTEPPPPSSHRPGLDPRLDAICRKAMAKKPVDRYPSMAAFVAALTEFLRTEGEGTLRQAASGQAPAADSGEAAFADLPTGRETVSVPARTTHKAATGSLSRSSSIWVVGAAVAGAVVLGAAVLAFVLFSSKKPGDGKSQARGNAGTEPSAVQPLATQREDRPTATQPEPPANAPEPAQPPEATPAATDPPTAFTLTLADGRPWPGWEGLFRHWTLLRDGTITGSTGPTGLSFNTFLCSKKKYKDFELSCKVRLKDGRGNSGIQFRSEVIDPEKFIVRGPQADIGRTFWGSLYGEKMPVGMMREALQTAIAPAMKPTGSFQDFYVRCVGKRVTIKVNDKIAVDDEFPNLPDEGIIAWQLHHGEPMEVTFKDIKFTELAAAGTAAPAPPAVAPPVTAAASGPPPGFRALFNGKDLTGWQAAIEWPQRSKLTGLRLAQEQQRMNDAVLPHWEVVPGVLQYDGRGNSLETVERFGDFELLLDWKIPPGGDSGVYLRGFPQVQIWDKPDGSGGLYNNKRGPSKPLKMADKPVGEWNTMRILMRGDRVTVHLNDQLVVDNTPLENFWEPGKPLPARGPIQLQHHSGPLWFRNIYIRGLGSSAATPAEPWRELFNGNNLIGWIQPNGGAPEWKVENGYMEVQGNNIMTRETFGPDFQLQAEFLVPSDKNRGNSGIYLQGRYEIQILDSYGVKTPAGQDCGSLYNLIVPSRNACKPPGQWQTFDITFRAPRVDGAGRVVKPGRLTVVQNGITIINDQTFDRATGQAIDQNLGLPGPIMLQSHGRSAVRFRNLKIRPLPAL